MLVMDLMKVLPENEVLVLDYDNNYLCFKIIKKHYQLARCIVAINDKAETFNLTPLYKRIRDTIVKLEVSTDSDGHIPYLLAKVQ